MKKKKAKYFIIYIVAIIICILLIYVVPYLMGAMERTYVAKNGTIEKSVETSAYVLREETVFLSSKAGTVERLAEESELVRANQQIVTIDGKGNEEFNEKYKNIKTNLGDSATSSEAGVSTVAGYVTYSVDGAEYILSNANLENLKKSDLDTFSSFSSEETVTGKCAKSEPLFKVTANGDWWLVFYVKNDDAEQYAEGDSVDLEIGKESLTASVSSVKKGKSSSRIELCCDVFVKNYLTSRTMDIKVTTASASGLVVNNNSIVEYEGNKGVIIKNNLGYKEFVRIGILADDGEQSAVCDSIFMDADGNYVNTIKVYDEILTNPDKADLKEATESTE